MRKKKRKKSIDKRLLENKQNITKEYAVSYALLTYNHLHPNCDEVKFACAMIELMRAIKPRFAVKEANKLLDEKNK